MPNLVYSVADFEAYTRIISADVNSRFTDIKTLLNTTKLDSTNVQLNGLTRDRLAAGTAHAVVTQDSSGNMGAGVAPGTSGNVLTSNGTDWVSSTPALAPSSPYEIYNVGLATSVGSSAMTIALKQSDGSTDPTAGSSTKIGFRDATAANGTLTERAITGALSMVIPATATLGSASGIDFYVWVYALDNAGTVELAVSGTRYDGAQVRSSTTIAAASNTRATIYSTTGRSNVPIRLIGRLKVNEATAGTWASNSSEIVLAPSLTTITRQPSVQVFTSGSGTYTTPLGVSWLRVTMVGGGGGGGSNQSSGGGAGSAGGDTTFGNAIAGGGGGGAGGGGGGGGTGGTGGGPSAGGEGTGLEIVGGTGSGGFGAGAIQFVGGVSGGNSILGGGGGYGYGGRDNSGGGGAGAGASSGNNGGGGGGAGGGVIMVISSPKTSYSYAVGAAGGNGAAAGAGGSGVIMVEEY